MESEVANIFRVYKQEENNFTNGLFSLLLLALRERRSLIRAFLKDLLNLRTTGVMGSRMVVQVLRGIQLADAELCGRNSCIRFEAKVASRTLQHEQVHRHLRELRRQKGRLKRVILLTPDDSASSYIKNFLAEYKKCRPHVLHLEWRRVYDYLHKMRTHRYTSPVLKALVEQFLDTIEERIFDQDMAGVITKISFGDSTMVYHETYLDELPKEKSWDTPRKYEELDGRGRKLLLYDGTRKAITAEVEIKKVEPVKYARKFKWRNKFAEKPKILEVPICLKAIRSIPGFENFGKHRKDRSAYRNLTREQYRQLMKPVNGRH